ncbi:MAG: glycosyltransferase family protein [Ignavibacteriales bacterium]|nr:glycosyltransferase family protein [Ignavibacteriales bacterium]
MPYSSEIVNNLGVINELSGFYDAAMKNFNRALELDAENVDALYNLGNLYLTARKYDEAAGYYHQVLRINEFYFKAYNNLGVVYQQLDELEKSEQYLRKGLEIQPDFPELLNNLGNTLRMKNSLEEAKSEFSRAILIRPKFAEAHKNLGMTLLLQGHLEEGWKEFEWRWQVELKKRPYDKPEWAGELIPGKRLFVYSEQGLGDTLQFIRFLKHPTEAGMEVILQCQDELLTVLESFPFANKLVASSEYVSEDSFDFHVPLLSIPMHLHINEEKVDSLPYIFPSAAKVAQWKTKLPATNNVRVGLVWAGNKDHKNDRNRSIKLETLENLFNISHVQFFSLQKGEPEMQAAAYSNKITRLGDELKDFTDTAAVLSLMDVIITVDTAVAHAAGAIGALAWILLPYSPDWRWQLETEKTPWYRKMKLFRREAGQGWQPIVRRLENELTNLTHIKHN